MTSPSRPTFGLSGPSIALDDRTDAVRGDLADIALAGKLFVPHYAIPMEMRCVTNTSVQAKADPESESVCTLAVGDSFMAVDMAGTWAWGFSKQGHVVGYVPLSALEQMQ